MTRDEAAKIANRIYADAMTKVPQMDGSDLWKPADTIVVPDDVYEVLFSRPRWIQSECVPQSKAREGVTQWKAGLLLF